MNPNPLRAALVQTVSFLKLTNFALKSCVDILDTVGKPMTDSRKLIRTNEQAITAAEAVLKGDADGA